MMSNDTKVLDRLNSYLNVLKTECLKLADYFEIAATASCITKKKQIFIIWSDKFKTMKKAAGPKSALAKLTRRLFSPQTVSFFLILHIMQNGYTAYCNSSVISELQLFQKEDRQSLTNMVEHAGVEKYLGLPERSGTFDSNVSSSK
ncbi:uncharacterized protein LOC135849123 [Planococcus citri]|uniref:uncharacterized protein LOC135849123 n=1 Tax=Planococcus citri TaxID=170843 RepID=UPI0031F7F4E7